MRFFTVHAAPAIPASVPDAGVAPVEVAKPPVLLREGFSWPAFILGPFWFAWHFLFAPAAAMLALIAAAVLLLPPAVGAVVVLGLHILAGLEARDARRAWFARHGMPAVAVVAAPDLDTAWSRLMRERPDLVRAVP